MEDKIYVLAARTEDDVQLILDYTKKSKIFYTKVDRVLFSNVQSIIYKNDEAIGFLNLVDERVRGALFMDIFIDEKYRGNGYASLAYKSLERKFTGNDFILAETKKDNIGANLSLLKDGTLIKEKDDTNFYLLNKDRVDEFLNSESYNEFVRVFELDNKVYVKK